VLDARTCKALQRLDPAVACMPDSVMSDREIRSSTTCVGKK
jgi:hypothetical protein